MADQIYKVRDPQGNIREIKGPAGASDEEVIAQAQKLFAEPTPAASVSQIPTGGYDTEGLPAPRQPSFGQRLTRGFEEGVKAIQQTLPSARALAQPSAEMLMAAEGARRGAQVGTMIAPFFGPAAPAVPIVGGVLGGGLSVAGTRGLFKAPETMGKGFIDAALDLGRDIRAGITEQGIGTAATPVLNALTMKAAQAGGTLMDLNKLPKQLAAQIARAPFTSPEQVAAARAAMRAPGTEGLTAQQAMARGGVIAPSAQASLEKAIKKTGAVDTRAVMEAEQEAARQTTLRSVTPNLQAAVNARREASKPLYEAADNAVVQMDEELSDVISRMPSGTLAAAANIAKMEGQPFIMGKNVAPTMVETGVLDAAGRPVMREMPGQVAEITGKSLHYVKRALSDIAYGPTATTGAGRDAQLAARGLLDDYIKVFESKVPEYGEARRVFSNLSAPVNQAQVLKEMVSVLEKPGGGERIVPFLNVLGRGEQAMLKRAGGRGGARFESLSEVLTPEQISKVRDVARQLEVESSIDTQVSAGRQRAAELIKDELPNYRLPNIFNVFATAANRFLDIVGAKISEKTMRTLANASLSAKSFDDLLATLPGEERSKVLRVISDPATWAAIKPAIPAATAGLSSTPPAPNALSQEQPQNALAQ